MQQSTLKIVNDAIEKFRQKEDHQVFRTVVILLAQISSKLATKEDVEITDRNFTRAIAGTTHRLAYANELLKQFNVTLRKDVTTNKVIAKYNGTEDISTDTFIKLGAECLIESIIDKGKTELNENGYITLTYSDKNHLKTWLVTNKAYKVLIQSIIEELGLKIGISDKSATIYIDGSYSSITGYKNYE